MKASTIDSNPFAPFPNSAIDQSIPSRFEEQVLRHPDRLAVKTESEVWTYAELNRVANRIAHAILAARGRKEEPILLFLEQGALLVAAILGALKAGKIYVPLDPAFPSNRVAAVLEDSRACLIVVGAQSQRVELEQLAEAIQVLSVDDLTDGQSSENPDVLLSPLAGAYIYYTSGSTGRPKGVFDIHCNVLHNIMRYTNSLRISPTDRLTLLQGPSFSGAVSSMFGGLLNGAAIFPFDVRKKGVDHIAFWLRREAITMYHSVPVLFRYMAASGASFPDLRLIRLEGDQASVKDIELFKLHFSERCVLVNGLGATECGIVRQYFVRPDTPIPKGIVPIGYSVQDMDVSLVDESGQEIHSGDIGEICVKSHYLSPGYWGRSDITALAFAASRTDPGVRLYRTGDLGRMRADGCLEYLGRKDFQVKVRGHRVEIAEVEAALLALTEVREAAVITRQDKGMESRLVAYVVPAIHQSLTTSFLRRQMVARLPHFMVPSVYIIVDALPLNTNGKVDRKALPTPRQYRPDLEVPFIAPQTLLQQQVALVWESVLGIVPVGIRDEFFDLGGDSLLVVSMLVEVERALSRAVPLSVMLEGAMIERLADAIQREAPDLSAAVVPIKSADGGRPFFFLHGDYMSGGFYCTRFADYLGRDQSFYALPPCGLDGDEVPPSYAAMAKRHIEAVQTVQPEGPYLLGGLCNGGLVAYEMARLLQDEGQKVDLLVLVASIPASPKLAWPQYLRRVRDMISFLSTLSLRERMNRVFAIARKIPWRLWHLASRQKRNTNQLSRAPSPLPLLGMDRQHLRSTYLRIDKEYDPGPYTGCVTLFWPVDDPISSNAAASCWRHLAPEVNIRVVPGTHFTCLTVHARAAAEELRRCLKLGPTS